MDRECFRRRQKLVIHLVENVGRHGGVRLDGRIVPGTEWFLPSFEPRHVPAQVLLHRTERDGQIPLAAGEIVLGDDSLLDEAPAV